MSTKKELPAPSPVPVFYFVPRPQVFGDWTVPLSLMGHQPAPKERES